MTTIFASLFRINQGTDVQGPEYQRLVTEPGAAETQVTQPELTQEQMMRAEFRRGDVAAEWAAYISTAIFLTSTLLIVLNSGIRGPFIFHPTLQSLGISFFAYGILTLQPTSQPRTKAAGLNRHQLAMISGFVSFMLGISAMIYNKTLNHSPHFTTSHGILGITAVMLLFLQLLFGASSVWFEGKLLGGPGKAKAFWKYHRLSGYLVFSLLVFTAHLGGGWSTWVVGNSPHIVRLMTYTVAPLILLGAIVVRVRPSKMKFL